MNNEYDFIELNTIDGSGKLMFKDFHSNIEIFYSNKEGEEINKSISCDELKDFTLKENIEGIIDYTLQEELNIDTSTFQMLEDSLREILTPYSIDTI